MQHDVRPAYKQGWDAAKTWARGEPVSDINPYPWGAEDYWAWLRGWNDGADDFERYGN